jgi:hypothetical protein
MFATIQQVKDLLASGRSLVLAGEEDLLRAVPRGRWIGGTIPYFMTADGGKTSRDGIFIEEVPSYAHPRAPVAYDVATIPRIGEDAPDNGYTILILPAFTEIHQTYALRAPEFKDLFLKAVAGWISGIHLDDLGKKTPKVFNGATGEVHADRGVALHIDLPETHRAQIGIVNIFEPGDGPEIRFPASGFEARDCTVDGERQSFSKYVVSQRIDTRLPLVANFCGAMINVSIQAVDPVASSVKLYAPVFEGVSYHFAKPVENYPQRFAAAIPSEISDPVFTCNCVLNYLYGDLEHRRTGTLLGPMTFGEIAFQLLNQTLVHVTVSPAT